MKIVYSFDTNRGKKKFDEFFFRMAELSVFSAKRTGYSVILYTDVYGAISFRKTRCQFDEVKIVDWFRHDHHEDYWNFCKLQTYAWQTTPFLHIDFDVYLHEGFTIPEEFGIVTEMRRDYSFVTPFRKLAIMDVYTIPDKLICSGLLGGTGMHNLWLDVFDHACDVCKKKPMKNKQIAYLVGVEEFCTSQMAMFYECPIHELDMNKFSHFQGENKKERFGFVIESLYNQFIKD